MNRISQRVIEKGLLVCLALLIALTAAPARASWDPETVLTAFMKSNYPWKEIEVSDIRIVNDMPDKAPEGVVLEKGPLGNAIFSLMFSDDTRLIVKANVTALAPVVISKRAYRKGHVISYEDVYVSSMDIRKLPRSTFNDPEDVVGKSLRRSISLNVPIVENMVESSRMVKRGKRVVLLINQHGLKIKTPGVIKEKGYIGKTVRAMNMSSRKEVVGVLINESTVKVEL